MATASLQLVKERRANHRYPVAVALEYKAVLPDRGLVNGRGAVVNMSSSGVLFNTAEVLPRGVAIELYIAWPTKLDDTVALNLYVRGRTVRTNGVNTVVGITKSEFRIRGRRATADHKSLAAVGRIS